MSAGIVTRLRIPHAADCYAVKNVLNGTWGSPWMLDGDERTYLDRRGWNQGGTTSFLRFRCNCTHCPAIVLVSERDIARLVPPYLPETRRKHGAALPQGDRR